MKHIQMSYKNIQSIKRNPWMDSTPQPDLQAQWQSHNFRSFQRAILGKAILILIWDYYFW